MKRIPLTQGKFAIVDDADYEKLSKHKWYFEGRYAVRRSPRVNGKQHTIWMHRIVNNTPDNMDTDHINHDRLDNRRSNLRSCTRSENRVNTPLRCDNTSGFKGVTWDGECKKWTAQIGYRGTNKRLGRFSSKEEAACAYNQAAQQLFGKHAHLNSITN